MITYHLNGEIVRHRDTKQINRRRDEKFDNENRCKYGIQQNNCQAWREYVKKRKEVKTFSAFGRCILSGCKECPERQQRVKTGSQKKTFSIDWKTYRKVSSAAHHMIKTAEHKTIFLTLTFGKWRKQHKLTKTFFYDEIANKCFSKFVENLRKNYGCSHYIGVKEYGGENGRVHFHLLAALPFRDFRDINDAWNHAISAYCEYSSCALQSDKKQSAIIKNAVRAVRYVCKYINKSFGVESGTRIVFISNSLLGKTVTEEKINHITGEVTEEKKRISNIKRTVTEHEQNIYEVIRSFKGVQIHSFDHVTVFKIRDYRELNRFYIEMLYPLFEIMLKPSGMITLNTIKTQK